MNNRGERFDYLLEKISKAEMQEHPFAHMEITNLLAKDHFDAIVGEPQIALDGASSTEELLDNLEMNGYQVIPFPGAISSKREYLD